MYHDKTYMVKTYQKTSQNVPNLYERHFCHFHYSTYFDLELAYTGDVFCKNFSTGVRVLFSSPEQCSGRAFVITFCSLSVLRRLSSTIGLLLLNVYVDDLQFENGSCGFKN